MSFLDFLIVSLVRTVSNFPVPVSVVEVSACDIQKESNSEGRGGDRPGLASQPTPLLYVLQGN